MIKITRRRHWLGVALAVRAVAYCAAGAAILAPIHAYATACAAAWVSTQVYTAGNTASENGINYVANWWTQGNNPATNNGGTGTGEPWTSQGACGTTTCSTVPSTPTGLAASSTTTTGTTLSWSAVTPPANCTITSYTIYKSGTSIGTATGTSFSVTGLAAGTTYSFTVAAADSDGTGSQSSSISVTTPSASCTAAPSAPSGLAASGTTSTGTTLNWSAVTAPANCSISGYTVYKGGTSIGTATGTSFSVTGLTASTTYTFTVAATDSDGTGAQSSSISVTTSSAPSCTATPTAPAGLAASGTTTSSTTLSWNAVTAPANCTISGYTVYLGGIAIATVSSGTSYTASGLTASTTYTFTVAATDAHGTSGQSSSVSVTTSAAGPPNFGPNVYIFTPSTPAATIQTDVNNIYAQQETNQFGTQRYAVLFQPGSYHVDMLVGFYTQVLGLGLTPNATTISGYVNVNAAWNGGNATQNFWRGAENFALNPSDSGGYSGWAVSQAAPLRRMHIEGNLVLADTSVNPPGWASGGFLGDSLVDDEAEPISQQQWLSRNSQWASWSNSVWNMVFVGCVNAPATTWPSGSNTSAAPTYTTIAQTPVIREKPFLNVDSSGNYWVFVPGLRTNVQGNSWSGTSPGPGTNLPISDFYIAQSTTDNATTINAALSAGKDILFTPGVYALNGTIAVNNPNTVILGIGLPTLQANSGQNAMQVADVDGVTVAGLLFEAASKVTTLLQVGPAGSSVSHAANPTLLADIFTRVGGAVTGQVSSSVVINSDNVIGDDFWFWRADHGNAGTFGWTINTEANGLIVNGQNVTIYGLANEHSQQYQTLWNGNGGRTYFYQSEAPYDVPNESSWMDGTVNGYASYKVANTVSTHDAWGLGIYCYFNVNPSGVSLQNAIESPSGSGIDFTDMMTDSLGGVGTISSIINGDGGGVLNNNGTANENSYLASYE